MIDSEMVKQGYDTVEPQNEPVNEPAKTDEKDVWA